MAENTAPKIQPASTPAHRALQLVELSNAAMEKAAAFQATVQQKQAAADAEAMKAHAEEEAKAIVAKAKTDAPKPAIGLAAFAVTTRRGTMPPRS